MAEGGVPSKGCGHVFVLNCNVDGLAADAILIPGPAGCDRVRLQDGQGEQQDQGAQEEGSESAPSGRAKVRIYEAPGIGAVADEEDGETVPEAGGSKATDVIRAQCFESMNKYLELAGAALQGKKSAFSRAKPLLGASIPGAGATDASKLLKREGDILKTALTEAYTAANKYGVDVALCTVDRDAYLGLLMLRSRICPFTDGPFWMLDQSKKATGERLQKASEAGRLSLFFGAGVSFPSGLPSWGGLLAELGEKAGFDKEQREALGKLGYLDQPTLMEEQMGSIDFKDAVAECVRGGRYTPAHALLSGLGLPAATTNYDGLYEASAASRGEVIPRLPWDSERLLLNSGSNTVLKMHGCVSHPESIVLTRRDYMRYPDFRQALRGRLQDLLMTTEVLFIGFSMTDDNVHLIIDQVRKQLYVDGKASRPGLMGTVLSLLENKMFRKLWDQDFSVASFGSSWADNPAWRHDCFLDYLATQVAERKMHSSSILNPRFRHVLTDAQRSVADAFAAAVALKDDKRVTQAPCWDELRRLLERLGMPS